MPVSHVTDGFRLAYDRAGAGPPAVLLHGWPGDRRDYRQVAPRLTGLDVVVPDLRGFGESDQHLADPAAAYSAAAQARSVIALIEELDLRDVVIAGYDIGSRIAQMVAATRPGLLRGLVTSSTMRRCGCCRQLVISHRWRHRTSSRRRSWRQRAWPATAGNEAPCGAA